MNKDFVGLNNKMLSNTRNNMASIYGTNVKENDIEKGGEGSKGGKVIGHTKSGKAIYGEKSPSKGHKFEGWNKQDHLDALEAHGSLSDKHDKESKNKELSFTENASHKSIADKHHSAAKGHSHAAEHWNFSEQDKKDSQDKFDSAYGDMSSTAHDKAAEVNEKAGNKELADQHRSAAKKKDFEGAHNSTTADQHKEMAAMHEKNGDHEVAAMHKKAAEEKAAKEHPLKADLNKFMSKHTDSPKHWGEGSAELAEMHSSMADHYNDQLGDESKDKKYTAHEGYSKTPEESHKRHKEGIKNLYDKLSDQNKDSVKERHQHWFDKK